MLIHSIKIILCFLTMLLLCSCSNKKSQNEVFENLDQYIKETAEVSNYAYQKDIGSWLAPETEYHYTKESNQIINLFTENYIIQQDRLYFQLSRSSENSSGADIWAYISLKTGEKHYLCPDPICPHTKGSECQFLNFKSFLFDPESETIAYAIKSINMNNKSSAAIYKIDLSDHTIQKLYHTNIIDKDVYFNTYDILFISQNIVYFTDTFVYQQTNTDGTIFRTEKTFLKALNPDDGTAEVIDDDYTRIANCLYAAEGKIYFINQDEKRLYVTDETFSKETTILTFDKECQVYNIVYDENTKEFYLLICDDALHTSADSVGKGILYCINSDLSCKEIDMPSEQITSFQLTSQYIYYTIYNPVEYGVTPNGISAIDENGNKIYRVSRSDTTKEELVFDGHGELFYNSGYIITGDYLYIDYCSLMKENGKVWFRRMGSTARINFSNGTIKWMNLD